MVQALARSRDRMDAEQERVEAVHATVVRSVERALGAHGNVVNGGAVLRRNLYLHPRPGPSVFDAKIMILVKDEDPDLDVRGQDFEYEAEYSIMAAGPDEARTTAVTVKIGETSTVVKDDQAALRLAEELVRGIEFVLRMGGESAVRPITR